MKPDAFYHEHSRGLQHRFGTTGLAGHLAEKYVLDRLEPEHQEWIAAADEVFVATVGPDGRPDCSYKGGLPGFVRVLDARTLELPSYDGNGMYRTLGNAVAAAHVALLFLPADVPGKLRVGGRARLLTDPEAVAAHEGAEAVLRITVDQVFENCPRYLHDRATGAHSAHCPRPGHLPPEPEWKKKPEYEGLLPLRGPGHPG
ncbi:pyridoxamine 5'-phosphate oxidase family protein [Streptomyces drozdowiczii]|uniref:Pyridoxamine 5'-phosphate oxidase family protein n=1 Tax=Streptomyces drozdowiczii TaxID=202862 RepID=A0ABY6Q1C9_9ACTN|nr:pyridoxamine 5'-phosphate oxidase family protein [Streptomyces drozdowiczii]MCX0241726.1 pyridoxamine 5'-phosphate oxidase family protein [Streptomyces drozdowiczii]UZK58052.1 pyridoxamine 5'-phosphate oxidase family protein [Streptomyces drozdowiczii]